MENEPNIDPPMPTTMPSPSPSPEIYSFEVFGKINEIARSASPPPTVTLTDQVVLLARKRSKISKRTNTPVFDTIEDAYRRRHKKLMIKSYRHHIVKFCKTFAVVVSENTQLLKVSGGDTWTYCRGFVTVDEMWKVAALLCHRVANLANTYVWG